MTPTRKSARAKPTKKPVKLTDATLMHFAYHPEAKLVRANVQQDVGIGGATQRVGHDQDIALDELPDDIRRDLERMLDRIAEHIGATYTFAPDTET